MLDYIYESPEWSYRLTTKRVLLNICPVQDNGFEVKTFPGLPGIPGSRLSKVLGLGPTFPPYYSKEIPRIYNRKVSQSFE